MPIASRFRHELTLRRTTPSGAADARGHQAPTTEEAALRGNLQERRAREVPSGEIAGVAISDAIAFLPLAIPFEPGEIELAGVRYEALGTSRDAGGRGRHRELDLRRIRP
jgi:hypothetical protein